MAQSPNGGCALALGLMDYWGSELARLRLACDLRLANSRTSDVSGDGISDCDEVRYKRPWPTSAFVRTTRLGSFRELAAILLPHFCLTLSVPKFQAALVTGRSSFCPSAIAYAHFCVPQFVPTLDQFW
jgi:hypothetical protein